MRGQEKVTKEKATPFGACRASMPGKSVRCGRAFRQDSCPDEKESTSLSIPLRAFRPHLTAAQGPHLKAARILRKVARIKLPVEAKIYICLDLRLRADFSA